MGLKNMQDIMPDKISVRGKDIRINDYIEGLSPDSRLGPIVFMEPYTGPLTHLFKDGATIVYWPSMVFPCKLTGMTIDHSHNYNVWRFKDVA